MLNMLYININIIYCNFQSSDMDVYGQEEDPISEIAVVRDEDQEERYHIVELNA